MQRHLVVVIGLVAVAATAGCNRNNAAISVPADAPAVAPQRTVAKTSAVTEEHSRPVETKTVATNKPQAKPDQVAADNSKKKEKAAEPQSERMAILTPGGPITVDVLLTIDGRPHTAMFEEAVSQVLAAADSDKDGRPTWKELAANKAYFTAQGEGMSPGSGDQLQTWTERFDQNRDGKIQRDEAAAWLGRDAGISARAFDVRGSRSSISVPSATSRIWKLLDADNNNRLSKSEIAHGTATLLSLDENDDGIIDPEEVAPLSEQLRVDVNQASAASGATSPYAAIYLAPQYEVDRLEFLLGDLYAPRQILRPSSFPALAGVYKLLDTDGDDQLTQNELAAMRTMDPQLKLAIDFRREGGNRQSSVTVREHIPEISAFQPTADRVVLTLGTTRIVVSALDRTFGQPSLPATVGSQIRMVVHDQCDALGELLDADGDGKLGEREIATCAERLLKYDTNNDGQISNSELPYSMIAVFVRGERPGEQSLYRPVSKSSLPVVADAPSWFVHSDYNGDGEVSRREFLGTIEQFSLLDENRDGYISSEEAKHATTMLKEKRN